LIAYLYLSFVLFLSLIPSCRCSGAKSFSKFVHPNSKIFYSGNELNTIERKSKSKKEGGKEKAKEKEIKNTAKKEKEAESEKSEDEDEEDDDAEIELVISATKPQIDIEVEDEGGYDVDAMEEDAQGQEKQEEEAERRGEESSIEGMTAAELVQVLRKLEASFPVGNRFLLSIWIGFLSSSFLGAGRGRRSGGSRREEMNPGLSVFSSPVL